jgi:hypothetical protein
MRDCQCARRVSCTTRMPCRRVMRAAGQRATAAPVGRFCYLEIVHTSDMLDNAVADVVPVAMHLLTG